MSKNFKYISKFNVDFKCLTGKEKDNFLSKAALDDLKEIIPQDIPNCSELLPIAFNSFVVNKVNKNHDVISTDTAIKCYKSFIHKYINWEHERQFVIGHIVNSALSKYSDAYQLGKGSEILEESDVIGSLNPFNVALAGVIYSNVSSGIVNAIKRNTDKESPDYMSISASWELGFDSYALAIGGMDLKDCEIISDPEKVNAYEFFLMFAGGDGKLPDGRPVYRLLTGDVTPLGVGLTVSPAAPVQGIVIRDEEENEDDECPEDMPSMMSSLKNKKVEKIISQSEKANVKKDNNIMKKNLASIKEVEQLTDENINEISIASLKQVLADEMEKVVREHSEKLKEKENEASKAKEIAEKAQKDLETVKVELEEIKVKQAEEESNRKFQERMASLDEDFELNDEQREIIVKQVKGLNDESYAAWLKDFSAFAKKKCKKGGKAKASDENSTEEKTEEKVEEKTEEKISTDSMTEEKEKLAEEALANVKLIKQNQIPNMLSGEEMFAKLSKAFSKETVKIEKK